MGGFVVPVPAPFGLLCFIICIEKIGRLSCFHKYTGAVPYAFFAFPFTSLPISKSRMGRAKARIQPHSRRISVSR